MHVLITAGGRRTEHWTELFAALCDRPDVALTVLAADVSAPTHRALDRLARQRSNLRYHLVPHLLGEDRTGHMASALFRPGTGRLLGGRCPDVVHVIGEAAYLTTWQAIRMRQRYWPAAPITLHAAQNIVMRFPVPFPRLERQAYDTVDHAFPITPAALGVLRAKGYRGAATIVPLGVDTTLFQPRPAPRPQGGRFTVGFVGRLEPHKGVRDLLRAVELLDCDLLAVGGGSLAPEIERLAANRPGRVRLHGWTDHGNLPKLLARMDVLVLPSIEVIQRNLVRWIGIPQREQFGRVLVEAMACGVPVVGSDVGEIPYVLGTAGLTYPAGDVLALVDRLARLRDNPDFARRLAGQGVARATTEFSWTGVADSMCRVWRQLTGTGGPGGREQPADNATGTAVNGNH
ncbi:glycosyltransferase involved in cell wall biosynthesis [Micromonospora pisi]|uniref:Glycosyltransferase involved in cell wall biosynthesis n=1 Tax=Micromonospora pisi TaxID=589240 RepID=A0A495JB62_9ACTN|nr:glycosyltransferase [Micromonospora pisi]RKR86145.1 glycosyltransferase involved in cell wall biosynthesis [Micromonospora pisi]